MNLLASWSATSSKLSYNRVDKEMEMVGETVEHLHSWEGWSIHIACCVCVVCGQRCTPKAKEEVSVSG